jgi:hypothetical protein
MIEITHDTLIVRHAELYRNPARQSDGNAGSCRPVPGRPSKHRANIDADRSRPPRLEPWHVAGKGTDTVCDDMGQRSQGPTGWADTVRDPCWQWLIRKGTPGMGAGCRRRGSPGRSWSAAPGAEPAIPATSWCPWPHPRPQGVTEFPAPTTPVAVVRTPWSVMQLDTGNLMADEPVPAPSMRDIPDGGVGASEHHFTNQRQLAEPDTLMPARRIPRQCEYPTARGLQLHAVVRTIAELIPERGLLPLGHADCLARTFLPGRPVRHGIVDIAIGPSRAGARPGAVRVAAALDLSGAFNPRPLVRRSSETGHGGKGVRKLAAFRED